MPNNEAVRQFNRPTSIRTPDQLQQAKRPDAPARDDVADHWRDAREWSTQDAGIIGQLQSERAHD